jgi:MFS family permease
MNQPPLIRNDMTAETDASASADSPSAPTPFYWGWFMVGVSFLVQGVGIGNQFLNGLLLLPLQNRYQVASSTILLGTAGAMMLGAGLFSPLFGQLAKRLSLRLLILIGITAIGLGYVGLAFATQFWQASLIYFICFSAGMVACNLGGNTLVSNWFSERRGRALGLASAGIATFGFVIPPVATYALAQVGLSETCLYVGAAALCVLPLLAFIIVDRPELKGLLPDGRHTALPVSHEVDSHDSNWTLGRLIRNRRFWSITAIAGLCTAVANTLITNLVPIGLRHDIDPQAVAYLASASAASSMIGGILLGRLFEALSQRAQVQIALALLLLTMGLFTVSGAEYWLLFAAAIALGFAVTGAMLATFLMIGSNFSREAFAPVYGIMNPFLVITFLLGIYFFGFSQDSTGSYQAALWGFMGVVLVCGGLTYLLLDRRKH